MPHIMVIGAGRVGLAAAKIIRHLNDWNISLVDTSEDALNTSVYTLRHVSVPNLLAGEIEAYKIAGPEDIEPLLEQVRPDVALCTTPFNVNVYVARAANKVGCHYVDFTEDNGVTKEIAALDVKNSVFVPQTGLAPGLVSYVGLSLFDDIGEPHSLDLRVGALPKVAFGPAHYAITWSPEGLVNEYIKPAYRKRNGAVEEVKPLTDKEHLLVDGRIYEGFTTAGGVGDLTAYPDIPFVEYKTLRHPGHLDFIKTILLSGDDFTLEKGVQHAKDLFQTTRDDVVVMAAHAVDKNNRASSFGMHFKPHADLDLTALELTTAGTGVAVIELILSGMLSNGVKKPSDITLEDLFLHSKALELVFSTAS